MDFSQRRLAAISEVRAKLRQEFSLDRIFVFAWRCTIRPSALEHWLFSICPHQDPEKMRKEVAKKGKAIWNPDGIGASMDDLGWDILQKICKKKEPDLEALSLQTAKNLHTLVGYQAAAKLLNAAGTLRCLASLTQRDCERLGNESGMFGGPQKSSILQGHELSTSQRALRILASRVVLAARLDAFGSDRFKGESFREEVLYAQ